METVEQSNKENTQPLNEQTITTKNPQEEQKELNPKNPNKWKGEALDIGGGNFKKNNNNLQKHFERFRKVKKDEIKYRNYVASSQNINRKDPEFKQRLREKFLQTVKKYFGVPYARRYWKEGEEHYDAPLYLDCCALVRQAVYDLREDFGFHLDRWNQAYQFDTLPIDLKFEEMKPGDLVFYSGTYYNTKLRAQKHDMVHVEVFTGGESGEQSIGARWQRGVVKYFDSYKFTSTAYHSIKFHYRSIDTWLEGVCKSHCDVHAWSSSALQWAPGKNSIFNFENDYDENDLDAPLFDDNEDEENHNTETQKKSSDQINLCFIGAGNNPGLAKESLIGQGYQVMSRGMQFSDKYRFKWVQTRQEINFMQMKEGKHIVNHLQNSQVFTCKTNLMETIDLIKVGQENMSIDSSLPVSKFWPETYRLDIVPDLVQFLNAKSDGLWLQKNSNVNQGVGIKLIEDINKFKEDLLIKEKEEAKESSTDILMKKLDEQIGSTNNAEESKQVETQSQEQTTEQKQQVKKWSNMNSLVKHLKYLTVQKYLEKPLLLKNKKFDIRCFMIVACQKPYLIMANKGYVRLCLDDYDTSKFSQKDKKIHLTNNSLQKKHPEYKERKEESIMSVDRLAQQLVESKVIQNIQEFDTKIWENMKKVMQMVFKVNQPALVAKFGCFELFGFDFMIDEELNPVLIEINTNPALFADTIVQKELLPKLVDDCVKLGIDCHPYGASDGKAQVEGYLKGGLKELKLEYDVIYSQE